MKRLNRLLLIVLAFSFSRYMGQSVIDYSTFLSIIKSENPLAKRAYNNKAYSQFQLKSARGNFDPQLNSGIENKFFNGTDYFTTGNAEVKQQLYTSQYLKFGYQYGQGGFVNPENYTSLAGLPYIGIQASLLQGLLFDKNRAELIKSKYYVDYYNAEEKIQLNDLLYLSANAYSSYLYQKKVNSLYLYFSNLALQRLNGIKDLSVIGERPIVDTIEAAIFLQSRILDLKSSELELIKKSNELKVFILEKESNQNPIIVKDSIDFIYAKTKQFLPLKILNENNVNPIITQYSAKQKVLETEVKLKKEMIKPILDVNYNFLNNPYSNRFTDLSTNNYKWSGKFSLPLYLRKPKNEYKISGIIAQNNQFELDYKQTQIEFKRRYLMSAIQIVSEQILNAEKSTSYSKLLLEAERLKFSNGESSLFILNARENKWLETELKLAEYKTKYVALYFELIHLDGSLTYEFNN